MQNDGGQAAILQREPLAAAEMEPLWRRERQVSWLNVAAMGAFLLAGLAAHRLGELAWINRSLLAAAIALLLVAAVLQMRARCPRCRTQLRSKILRMLPDKCTVCGTAFPRPPSANG
jgi:hypothetical protein